MKRSRKWLAFFAAALVTACLASASAFAQALATLELDSLSAFYFEGDGRGAMISSASIPIELTPQGRSSWLLRVPAAGFALPEITYPSGKRVAWKLSADATGVITANGGELVCQLTAPAIAYVDEDEGGIPMTLTFSTETLSAAAKGFTAERQGVRVDPGSGYVQLVTAAVNPLHAATAPGNPFVAVLSGRIVGFSFQ